VLAPPEYTGGYRGKRFDYDLWHDQEARRRERESKQQEKTGNGEATVQPNGRQSPN
jgi:hypothetical protein